MNKSDTWAFWRRAQIILEDMRRDALARLRGDGEQASNPLNDGVQTHGTSNTRIEPIAGADSGADDSGASRTTV